MAVDRPREQAVPWESPTLRAVLASTLVLPLGVPLVSPALPVVRDALGLTDPQASLLITVYFLPGVLVSPLVGVLVDRRGRRPVLLAALLTFGVSGGLVALGPSFAAVLALRAAQGTGAAGVFVVTVTLLGDAFGGADRNTVMGTTVATLSVGRTVYPVVGGVLAAVAWNAPFVASLLAIPVGLFVHRTLPESASLGAAGAVDESPSDETVDESSPRGAVDESLPSGAVDESLPSGAVAGMVSALVPPRESLVLFGATLTLEVVTFGAIMTALPFLLVDRFGLASGGGRPAPRRRDPRIGGDRGPERLAGSTSVEPHTRRRELRLLRGRSPRNLACRGRFRSGGRRHRVRRGSRRRDAVSRRRDCRPGPGRGARERVQPPQRCDLFRAGDRSRGVHPRRTPR